MGCDQILGLKYSNAHQAFSEIRSSALGIKLVGKYPGMGNFLTVLGDSGLTGSDQPTFLFNHQDTLYNGLTNAPHHRFYDGR